MPAELMLDFARRTGLSPASAAPHRYLWTDAFAVCNFLGLYASEGDARYLQLALALVDQVHHTLGRHRADDDRDGWISGLNEREGEQHPTIGGLRIGKDLPERGPAEAFDEALEWERDGQYFHYLSKWMHALQRVARVTGDSRYKQWAIELARTAHGHFTYLPPSGGPKRMYWKMSIDLGRPLVPSMGQQDPLDGYIGYCELGHCPPVPPAGTEGRDLLVEISDMAEICRDQSWVSGDTLGIGGLLCNAWKLAWMSSACGFSQPGLLERLLQDTLSGLQYFVRTDALDLPASCRLPFREFGLAIGLHALDRLWRAIMAQAEPCQDHQRLRAAVAPLTDYLPLAGMIESFWRTPENRSAATWDEHRDINSVMLATSLAPDGFLMG